MGLHLIGAQPFFLIGRVRKSASLTPSPQWQFFVPKSDVSVFLSEFVSDPRPQVTRPAGAGHATRGRGSLAMRRSETEISLGKPASPRGRTYHWLAIAVKPSKHRNYSGGFIIANCAGKKCTAPCLSSNVLYVSHLGVQTLHLPHQKAGGRTKKRMVRLDSLPSFFNVRLCGLCWEANDWTTGSKATYSSILRISSTMLEPFSRASSISNTLSLQPAMSATSLSSIFKGDWP